MTFILLFFIALGLLQPQSAQQLLARHHAVSQAVRQQPASHPTQTPAESLTALLAAGGSIALPHGGIYAGSFTLKSNTSLDCGGSSITGTTGPTLDIPPGTHDVTVTNCILTTASDQRVVLVGRNEASQTTLDQVPQRIHFANITIPTYRGKRGFEINGAHVTLDVVTVTDLFDPAGRDSQTVWIGNTPGPVTITNSVLSGGTETIMVGGDTMKIPDVIPSDITIADCRLEHPLSWQTDGVKHFVKNLLELKTGHRVTLQRLTLDGSWKDAQSGWAFMITPRSGGDINGVLVEDVTVSNVAGVFNLLGRSNVAPATTSPTQNIVIRRVKATASTSFASGLGVFAMLGGEVHDALFDGIQFTGDGNYFLTTYAGTVVDLATGVGRPGAPVDSLTVTNSTFTAGIYGLFLNGVANAGPTQAGVKALTVTGNTISGASAALKKALPKNTYP